MARTRKSAETVPAIIVTGPAAGRRRANRRFGTEAVTIPLADLSEAELAAIRDDPELVVGNTEAEAKAEAEAGGPAA